MTLSRPRASSESPLTSLRKDRRAIAIVSTEVLARIVAERGPPSRSAELSEEVSCPERGVPSSRKVERRLSVENDEEGLSPLALANDGRARGEAAGARELRDPLHVPLRERREKGNPAKDIDPFRAERLIARPGPRTEDELVDSDLPHRATISSRSG